MKKVTLKLILDKLKTIFSQKDNFKSYINKANSITRLNFRKNKFEILNMVY